MTIKAAENGPLVLSDIAEQQQAEIEAEILSPLGKFGKLAHIEEDEEDKNQA